MLIYGHRGASADEPENTRLAFERAIEMGADGLEFDVQASSDGVLVLIHDRLLSGATNGSGNVDERTLQELQSLDAGKGERIPTFGEALDAIGDRAHLDIEIKQGGIERDVIKELDAHPSSRWAISSFDWGTLANVRALSAGAELWLLAVNVSEAVLDTAAQLNATGVALYSASLTEESARRLSEAGVKIVIWTVNDLKEAQRCKDLGAFGLCTDAPDMILGGIQ